MGKDDKRSGKEREREIKYKIEPHLPAALFQHLDFGFRKRVVNLNLGLLLRQRI